MNTVKYLETDEEWDALVARMAARVKKPKPVRLKAGERIMIVQPNINYLLGITETTQELTR